MAAVVLTPRSRPPIRRAPRLGPPGVGRPPVGPVRDRSSAGDGANRHGWWFAVLFVATVASLVWAGSVVRTPAHDLSPVGTGAVTPTVPAPPASAGVYTVRPGDTLWSIAGRIRPDADPRPVVDELARRSGGGAIQPGQQIPLDGLPD